ncbi:MobC family plasmid mobilization relaxosome protein [Brevundimonas sp. LF-1]|uniref:MobC family plasmid mobilization relaxosome protein n=1 Tax=Brevundimonas sp. LF-1 TaxID=3126100 RepID=UPI0030DF04B3
MQEAGEEELVERIALQTRGQSDKLTLRLRPGELSLLEAVSLSEGFTRTGWVTALVRSRLFNRPSLNPSDSEAYRLSVFELNRIGINLNQIARLMNQAAQEGVVLAPDVEAITEARDEIRKIALNLREVLRRNQASWG